MAKFRPTRQLRDTLSNQANGCCEYCKSPQLFSPQSFSVEHILPLAMGGNHEAGNLAFSCQGCNALKATRIDAVDALTGFIVPLFHPRLQNWNDHFVWDESWQYIIGRTPAGRATASLLQLNRQFVINLRRILILAGEHPPIE